MLMIGTVLVCMLVAFLFALYYLIPARAREILILLFSFVFYFCHGKSAFFYVLAVTVATYCLGRVLENSKKKRYLVLGIIMDLGILFVAKYLNSWCSFGWIVPLGLSYYTLMSLGYLIDLYRNEMKAEWNFLHFASFLCYFPQAVAGPISRAKDVLPQWQEGISFKIDEIRIGFMMVLIGTVEKIVLADQIAKFTNVIFSVDQQYEGFVLLIGILLYALRIYFDFAGYSLIAIGTSRILGIRLMDNFTSPYFSTTVKEFWRRWHRSLSFWFRDYLYIPLGGSRVASWRIDLNVFIVFLASGIWHGTSFGFLLWGALHGGYQIVGRHTAKIRERIWKKKSVVVQRLCVFLLVAFAFLPFQISSLSQLMNVCSRLFVWNPECLWDQTFLQFGVNLLRIILLCVLILIAFVLDWYQLKNDFYQKFVKAPILIRFMVYLLLVGVIVLLGAYGKLFSNDSFIYGQF